MLNRSPNVIISFLISFFFLLTLISSFTPPLHAANSKKKLSEKKLSQIKKNIEAKKRMVKETLKKERSVLSTIQEIEKDIQSKHKELKSYGNAIKKTNSEIADIQKELASLSSRIDQRKEFLKKRLRSLYKQQYGDSALILISAKDYNDFIRRSRYVSLIAYNDNKMMNAFNRDMQTLNLKITGIELLKAKLETSKSKAEKKERDLKNSRIQKDKLLASIRSKRSAYEKTIKELEESSQKLVEMINSFQKKTIPKSVIGKGFRAWKGRLPWPINGDILVPYGKYTDPKFKIAVFKNGIEIKAKDGYRPTAVAGGQVVYADWFKGYGKLMIINHGDGYHSLYGHLTEIFHKTGDIIKQQTTIGKVGISEILDVPTLYFELRYKGKPVNPMQWLKKSTKK